MKNSRKYSILIYPNRGNKSRSGDWKNNLNQFLEALVVIISCPMRLFLQKLIKAINNLELIYNLHLHHPWKEAPEKIGGTKPQIAFSHDISRADLCHRKKSGVNAVAQSLKKDLVENKNNAVARLWKLDIFRKWGKIWISSVINYLDKSVCGADLVPYCLLFACEFGV